VRVGRGMGGAGGCDGGPFGHDGFLELGEELDVR